MRRLCLVPLCSFALACGASSEPSGTASESGTSGGDAAESTGPGSSTSGSTDPSGEPGSTDPTDTTDTTDPSGTTGPSGSTGSGDGESSGGGSDESGDVLPRGQWAMTEVTYTEGGQSETLTMQDRTFCDATLAGGALQLRYQQQGGYTVWLLNVAEGAGVGEHTLTQDFTGVYMNINEVSDAWQAYFDPSMAFGTLTLTDATIQSGGVVAGTLSATLTSVDGTTTADFESTFYAEIP